MPRQDDRTEGIRLDRSLQLRILYDIRRGSCLRAALANLRIPGDIFAHTTRGDLAFAQELNIARQEFLRQLRGES
jgi:hypothetical protein